MKRSLSTPTVMDVRRMKLSHFASSASRDIAVSALPSIEKLQHHRKHVLAAVSDGMNTGTKCASETCVHHSAGQLNFFCFDCQAAICHICVAEMHESHRFSKVSDYQKEMVAMMVNCRQMLKDLENNEVYFSSEIRGIEGKITEQAINAIRDIIAEVIGLSKRLSTIKEDRRVHLMRISDNLKQHISHAERFIENNNNTNEGKTDNPGQLRNVVGLHHETVDQVMKLDDIQSEIEKLISQKITFEAAKTLTAQNNGCLVGQINWQNGKNERFVFLWARRCKIDLFKESQ
jgi:hypothetical protein